MLPNLFAKDLVIILLSFILYFFLGELANITRELHSCKTKLVSSEQDKEQLQAELDEVKIEKKELTDKYHSLKTQHDAASNKCQKTISMLKDSEKRQREISGKNEELTAEVEKLRKQLTSERESKQELETDIEKVREDKRRVEEDKRKLEEEGGRLTQEMQELELKIEHLKDENKSLEIRNNQLCESGHRMQRTNSDLNQQMYRMQRQRNSRSEGDVVAVGKTDSVQTVTPLQEHSDLHHMETVTPTTVQAVQTTTDTSQNP